MNQILEYMSVTDIYFLLMDRKFFGKEWLEFLESEKISYVLRCQKDTLVEGKNAFLYAKGWGKHLRTLEKQTKFLSRKSDFRYGLESIMSFIVNPLKNRDLQIKFVT